MVDDAVIYQLPGLADAQEGDVGLLFGCSLISRVIELGEDLAREGEQPPSHAFLIYSRKTANSPGLILESRWPRVSLRPFSEYENDRQGRVEIYRLPGKTEDKHAALDQCVARYLSHPYGLRAVSAMAVIEPIRRLGLMLPNWLAGKDSVFCSEMAAAYLWLKEHPGYPVSEPLPDEVMRLAADCDPAGLRIWLRGAMPAAI